MSDHGAPFGHTPDESPTTVVDRIGLLVTNDPAIGDGPLGIVRDAALVLQGERVVAVERAGAAGDRRVDVEGRCVLPGFVDSHTHLVFAGDRSDEFVARMAGAPYAAGGIRTTVDATRAATDEELRALTAHRQHEAWRAGITTLEIKSGYGLDVHHERRCLRVAEELSAQTTFLGAHVVPPEFDGRTDDYVELVCGEMLDAASPHARWIDAFCEVGAFDADQCRAVLAAGAARGLGGRLHANQLGHGPGVQLGVEMGCASVDHCTYLSDDDIDALASSTTVATFLPAADFSTRQPYPDARRALDAGVRAALATNCNPGSSYTTSMSFCIALAVRDLRMTIEEAVAAATVGGAAALRAPHVGTLRPGSNADLVVLDAPSYTHLVYRPGVPLVHRTWQGGRVVGA
ncbi:MAG: imidazolonepropionase [Acidimicrobiales bacterium]|nr:imidazolonepropionase [Acidimicrobiales bacterium]MCB9393838.1 imidazolonepropionase [Acidimicrobiaceae bacterium]